MLCGDVMRPMVLRCAPDTTATRCAQLMRDEQLGFVPVVDAKGQVIGVVTDRDLAVRVLAEQLPGSTPVMAFMTPEPFVTCQPHEDLRELEQRLAEAKRSRALVQDRAGQLLGVISLSDIAQAEPSAQRTARVLQEITRREAAR